MSFIEITESQVVPPRQGDDKQDQQRGNSNRGPAEQGGEERVSDQDGSLSHDMEVSQRLFSILSARSDVDHPICSECSAMLLSSMIGRLNASTKERDAYIGFMKSLQSASSTIPTDEDVAATEKSLKETLDKEKTAFEELKTLEAEKRGLESEIAELEEESQALEVEEQKFWAERNAFDDEMNELTTTLSSLRQKHAHDQQQLQALQRTNVYNDSFCIGHDGYFGTINGLRLGRLPSQNVEWSEINAAWGQTVLLLATIADRLNYSFQGYRLRPMGPSNQPDDTAKPDPQDHRSRSLLQRRHAPRSRLLPPPLRRWHGRLPRLPLPARRLRPTTAPASSTSCDSVLATQHCAHLAHAALSDPRGQDRRGRQCRQHQTRRRLPAGRELDAGVQVRAHLLQISARARQQHGQCEPDG
jgi:beclin